MQDYTVQRFSIDHTKNLNSIKYITWAPFPQSDQLRQKLKFVFLWSEAKVSVDLSISISSTM